MSKLTKFFKHPVMFFEDAQKNKKLKKGKPKIFVVGFSTWKTYLRMYFSEYDLIFLPKDIKKSQFNSQYRKQIVSLKDSCQVFIWGFKAPEYILEFLREEKISTKFVEDGFVRSVQLGATKAPPMSLCLDSKTPYFDATRPSELEDLLNNFDFTSKPELIDQAKEGINLLLETGVSKYNNSEKVSIEKFYGPKTKKRILVLGQVEDDASIQYGCEKKLTNNDVVRLAAEENPGDQIIYKPHPDVMNGHRPYQSNPTDVENIALVLKKDVPLSNAFETVDHVYTVTSLGGFEALLRGIRVTTLGAPFYSGWGLTDDRQVSIRRKRSLSIEELFGISYIIYPNYYCVETGEKISFLEVVNKLDKLRKEVGYNVTHEVNVSSVDVNESSVKTPPPVKAKAAVKAKPAVKEDVIPTWYDSKKIEIKDDFKPVFLYMPWIAEHGNTLIEKIENEQHYQIKQFSLVKGGEPNELRREVLRFALNKPDLYRKMVARKLIPISKHVKAFVFTFDWSPVMRIIVSVCKELGIKTILIPHESVFANRDKYYWCPTTFASVPSTDIVLSWGSLQNDIFIERGYPKDNIITVGAPKFDVYFNYEPLISRHQYCSFFGLSADKKIILFASQPLDSQYDAQVARKAQVDAVNDLISVAEKRDMQVIIRLPPSKDNILGEALIRRIEESSFCAIDDAICYFVNAEESIHHADIITSINSTMLFEAVIAGKPSFSLKYIEFTQIWENVGIPAVRDIESLEDIITSIESGGYAIPERGMSWAKKQLSAGEFDGKAKDRIIKTLISIANNDINKKLSSPTEKLFNEMPLDVIGIPSTKKVWETTQAYVLPMLRARARIDSGSQVNALKASSSADLLFQWGIGENAKKINQRKVAVKLGKKVIYIEDGFIRSLNIGLSGDPALSVIIDDMTPYYDSNSESRLEFLLNSDSVVAEKNIERSKLVIGQIQKNRITKYNHACDIKLNIGKSERKILLIDQRYGDQSVACGKADETTFQTMLLDAVNNNPKCDILIKQHPDAIGGGKESYFSNDKISFTKHLENVYLIDYDVNPHALFDIVEEVYVGTSGMGFEALLAGKKVTCYGAPFYSNWGVTTDKLSVGRRVRKRSIEEIFYFSYIFLSRYYNPAAQAKCEIEDVISYIVSKK
ncbi:capsular polysaccharide export protein, LipB/KpsS family [Halomonas sp. 18071143]|uniref:capsular polysaccharide export protein, LipB/KpsS family n=1 Tax=Halomonas sp. 18071143 TaxID=2855441 RepID=UPI001C43F945|nr:hypothetical protein [Halomonas sp. 18071143]